MYCRDELFNATAIWQSTDPSLSDCLRNGVLAVIPMGAAMCFAFYVALCRVIRRRTIRYRQISTLFGSKLLLAKLTCYLAMTTAGAFRVARLIVPFNSDVVLGVADSADVVGSDIASAAALVATCVIGIALLLADRAARLFQNAMQTLIVGLLWLTQLPTFKYEIDDLIRIGSASPWAIAHSLVTWPVASALLALNCLSEWRDDDDFNVDEDGAGDYAKPSAEETCPALPSLMYTWFTSLMTKGYCRQLDFADVSHCPRFFSRNVAIWPLVRQWYARFDRIRAVSRDCDVVNRLHQLETANASRNYGDDLAPLVHQIGRRASSSTSTTNTQLPWPLWTLLLRQYKWKLLAVFFISICHYLLGLVNPLMLRYLIRHVANLTDHAWHGYFYVVAMFCTTAVWSLSFHYYLQMLTHICLQLRASLLSLIFRKAMRLSNATRRITSTGQITNLMSVDGQRLIESLPLVPMTWSCFITIMVAMYLLYLELGPSMFGGLAVMALFIPAGTLVCKKNSQYEGKQLKLKDERLRQVTETLFGIKVIKLSAWEPLMIESIDKIRRNECAILKLSAKLNAAGNLVFSCLPVLVLVLVFSIYAILNPNAPLDAERVFVAVALLNAVRIPLFVVPFALVEAVKSVVSINRIGRFLIMDELDVSHIESRLADAKNRVLEIEGATFDWDADSDRRTPSTLTDVTLMQSRRQLTAVVGRVGAGKSSLLSAVLGDLPLAAERNSTNGNAGSIRFDASATKLAYVPQQAWIQNLSLRDNITFDAPFDADRYNATLTACCLQADLATLAAGDATEIGEVGINLSGGQKQRVALARAVYANADLYLLDDPLSAVDAHVANRIFDSVLDRQTGLLKDKSVILVTHNLSFIHRVDHVIVMDRGCIVEQGTYKNLIDASNSGDHEQQQRLNLRALMAEHARGSPRDEIHHDSADNVVVGDSSRSHSNSAPIEPVCQSSTQTAVKVFTSSSCERIRGCLMSDPAVTSHPPAALSKLRHEAETVNLTDGHQQQLLINNASHIEVESTTDLEQQQRQPSNAAAIIVQEDVATGRIGLSIYSHYLKSCGWTRVGFVLLMHIICEVLRAGSNYALAAWSDQSTSRTFPPSTPALAGHVENLSLTPAINVSNGITPYLWVYAGLGIAYTISEWVVSLVLFLMAVRASKAIHDALMSGVFRAPLSFFHANPTGRIVNRFSADIDVIDRTIPFQFCDFLGCLFEVVSVMVVVCISTPVFIVAVLPLAVAYWYCQQYYVTTSQQLKRLESKSKSPIFAHFSESVMGATSIRAYGQQRRFESDSETLVMVNTAAWYHSLSSNRWLGCRIEMIGNLVILFAVICVLMARRALSPGVAGLSISYALIIVDGLNWMVRMLCEIETNSVAIERVVQYAERNDAEDEWRIPDADPPEGTWPSTGQIEFDGYAASYRSDLDPVLHDVNLVVAGGQKIGVVGRTGAGKSSLTLALFRMIEARAGAIRIDAVNIDCVGLHRLRSALTIIPQEPVLFSGTLRFNLDPEGRHFDDEIWRCLEAVHLRDYIASLSRPNETGIGNGNSSVNTGLDFRVGADGLEVSLGQRQLLCLARALLRDTRILVLDEATAAIDVATDALIQRTIRENFGTCTVIIIAHRLNTILDCDRIVVLDGGRLIEQGTPRSLASDARSAFACMLAEYGRCNAKSD